jgi:hypothetical protein
MLVVAHAGHWLAQLLYAVPLVVLLGAILVSKVRERREARDRSPRPRD